jgi:hypothetical protein
MENESRSDRMYVAIVFMPDADEPVADLVYDDEQWASVTLVDRELELTVYGERKVPLDEALAALGRVRKRLLELSWPE